MIEVRAFAKINLSLDVLGRRTDGYHELRSVMQTISLHDTVRFHHEESGITGSSPQGDYSLIDRAIQAVLDKAGMESPPAIGYELAKRIPSAAGLGGGSSDCATAIRAVSTMLDLNLSSEELLSVAASLGADVPFFLTGGAALVEGRGERVKPLPDARTRWFLLAGQNTAVSTKSVFEAFKSDQHGDGEATGRALAALANGYVEFGGNDLASTAIQYFPEIGQTFDTLAQVASLERIAMTGSGGTVVAMFENETQANESFRRLQNQLPWLAVASSIGREQSIGRMA